MWKEVDLRLQDKVEFYLFFMLKIAIEYMHVFIRIKQWDKKY